MTVAADLEIAMQQLRGIAALAQIVDRGALEAGLEKSDLGDVVAPVLYPSEWTRLHKREGQLRDSVRAFLQFQAEIRRIWGMETP